MIRRVIIRPEAKWDLREAKDWYRSTSRQLSDDFVRRVNDAIALARERPLAFQIVQRTFRRILLHRFPYALFYYQMTIESWWSPSYIRLVILKYSGRERREVQ